MPLAGMSMYIRFHYLVEIDLLEMLVFAEDSQMGIGEYLIIEKDFLDSRME